MFTNKTTAVRMVDVWLFVATILMVPCCLFCEQLPILHSVLEREKLYKVVSKIIMVRTAEN